MEKIKKERKKRWQRLRLNGIFLGWRWRRGLGQLGREKQSVDASFSPPSPCSMACVPVFFSFAYLSPNYVQAQHLGLVPRCNSGLVPGFFEDASPPCFGFLAVLDGHDPAEVSSRKKNKKKIENKIKDKKLKIKLKIK